MGLPLPDREPVRTAAVSHHAAPRACRLAADPYSNGMDQITQLLSAAAGGARQAAHKLLPLVYDERRKLAAARLAGETPGLTLQPTALLHEAYLRLVGEDP